MARRHQFGRRSYGWLHIRCAAIEMPLALQSALGLIGMTAIAWLLSERRRAISIKFLGLGIALQFVLAALFLKVPWAASVFAQLNRGVNALAEASQAGTRSSSAT